LARLHVRRRQLSDDFDWRGAAHTAQRYASVGNDAPMDLFRTATAMEYNMVTEPQVTILAEMVTRSLRSAQVGREVVSSQS
jgi:hypothetical protein